MQQLFNYPMVICTTKHVFSSATKAEWKTNRERK